MSELALKLIAENKKSKATFLDLGKCGLRAVPEEIRELVWLEGLALSDGWFGWEDGAYQVSSNHGASNETLADIRPLAALHNLRYLSLVNTKVDDLSALSGLAGLLLLDLQATPVSDLSALSGLVGLQMLDLQDTPVNDLSVLSGLHDLQVLDLQGTPVSNLRALSGLHDLQMLDLQGTPVSDLNALSGLLGLQKLNLNRTSVSDLSALSGLLSLQTLNLFDAKVQDLRPIRDLIRKGVPVTLNWLDEDGIYVEDCPLTTPPIEIVSQGNQAILNYFDELERGGVSHLYEAKMLILGEGGAGKTSLLQRLYKPEQGLPSAEETTKGIEIYRHRFTHVNGQEFRLNVWDFGGQEIYHATHQFFLTNRSLYILLDDTRHNHCSAFEPGFRDWLDLIETFGGASPVLIFQNEKGGRSKSLVMSSFGERYGNVKEKYAGDLADEHAADALRHAIEHFASNLPHIGETLPTAWVSIRAEIEQLAQQQPHISLQEYLNLYARYLTLDEEKALHLSRYLHDLGVFLHFQESDLLRRIVILQNDWATKAVYALLDDEITKKQQGRFCRDDYVRLWSAPQYSKMRPELLQLMQQFELCYELPDSQPKQWLLPQLLPPEPPETLQNWPQAGDLAFEYDYPFMPKGLISRLMVRLHRLVPDPKLASRNCVLFADEASEVLVNIASDGRGIRLRARGLEPKALLSVVAKDLEAINAKFPGLRDKIEKYIPCICEQCLRSLTPHRYKASMLLKRKEAHSKKVNCDLSFQDVEVLRLLDGVAFMPAEQSKKQKPMKTIQIFLASSYELLAERDAIDLHLRTMSDRLINDGIYLKVRRWENFLDAMSERGLQQEYNQAVRESDIFLGMFATKVGKFTEEEFDTAWANFKADQRPFVYTYFKDTTVSTGSMIEADMLSLFAFKKKLKELKHYVSQFTSIEDLKLQMTEQIHKLLERKKL